MSFFKIVSGLLSYVKFIFIALFTVHHFRAALRKNQDVNVYNISISLLELGDNIVNNDTSNDAVVIYYVILCMNTVCLRIKSDILM